MIGSCIPRKLEVRLPHMLKGFQGTGKAASPHCQVAKLCGHPPPTPHPSFPPSFALSPRLLEPRQSPLAVTGRGIGGGTEGWGRLHKGIPHTKPPDRQLQRVKKPDLLSCSLAPIFLPRLGWGPRASASLPRGPTLLPVGGNRDTCLTSEAEPGTARGRRQTTRRETGKQNCSLAE